MNQQTQQALVKFSNILKGRSSYLAEVDERHPLDSTQIIAKIKGAIFVPFEERCTRTNKRKASWIFNRQTNSFVLNRLFTTGHSQFK